jgi:hypothetical protein
VKCEKWGSTERRNQATENGGRGNSRVIILSAMKKSAETCSTGNVKAGVMIVPGIHKSVSIHRQK